MGSVGSVSLPLTLNQQLSETGVTRILLETILGVSSELCAFDVLEH